VKIRAEHLEMLRGNVKRLSKELGDAYVDLMRANAGGSFGRNMTIKVDVSISASLRKRKKAA